MTFDSWSHEQYIPYRIDDCCKGGHNVTFDSWSHEQYIPYRIDDCCKGGHNVTLRRGSIRRHADCIDDISIDKFHFSAMKKQVIDVDDINMY